MILVGGDLDQTKKILRTPKVFQLPKDEKKNIWPKVIVVLSLSIIVSIGLIYFIFFSSFFNIKNIEMVGSQNESIKQILEQYKGKNLFSFKIQDLENQLRSANCNIDELKVYRGIPDTIRIKLADREPMFIWQTGDKQFLVDSNAIIYAEASVNTCLPVVLDKNNLSVEVPSQIATNSFVDFVRQAQKDMQDKVKIKNFFVEETTFQLTLLTEDNLEILFNTLRPLSDQIDAFDKVYSQYKGEIKQYVDLRVEGKVYYK